MVNATKLAAPPPFLPPDDQLREDLDAQQARIQIVLFITFLIFATILILGRLRSRGNSFFKMISTNLFMITAYLISFIPGLMSTPGQSNDLYIFWIAFMAYLAAASNEVSCYTLGDNEDRKKRLIIDYAVVWPLILTSLNKNLAAPEIIVPIVIIFCVVVLKLRERSRALRYATNSSNGFSQATKVISVFDKQKKMGGGDLNSSSYYNNFLVGLKEAHKMMVKQSKTGGITTIDFFDSFSNSHVITLDKVLDMNETFLVGTNIGKEIQHTCISFAMFSVLLAKIAGYNDVDAKIYRGAHNKLPDNILSIVEKELDFLYDYLFTNYYAIYDRGVWKKFRDLCVIVVFFWLALPLLVEYYSEDHNVLYVYLGGFVLDNGFTRFVILAIITIELAQVGVFLTSNWAKIMYTCVYFRNQTSLGTTKSIKNNILQRLLRVACLVPRPKLSMFCFSTLTKRKIGQYSFLNCYAEIPGSLWVKCWIGSYFELPKIGQAGDSKKFLPTELQESVLKAINNSLSNHEGKFTNGVCSLKENMVDEEIISRYVRKEVSQSHIILVWHIATSLIEEHLKTPSPTSNDKFQSTATTISNYCAYLVAFLPKMLPDHVYTTQCEFVEAVKQLKYELLDNNDEEDPKGGLTNGDQSSILGQARNLKEMLLEYHQESNLWGILAEFWTETLLFLALTENAEAIEAHANSLSTGGEFITHLWALLIHAGCSK